MKRILYFAVFIWMMCGEVCTIASLGNQSLRRKQTIKSKFLKFCEAYPTLCNEKRSKEKRKDLNLQNEKETIYENNKDGGLQNDVNVLQRILDVLEDPILFPYDATYTERNRQSRILVLKVLLQSVNIRKETKDQIKYK